MLASLLEIGEDTLNAVEVRRVFGQIEQVVGGLLNNLRVCGVL